MNTIRKALMILTAREKKQGSMILCLVMVMAIFEVAGVASVMPFLGVLASPEIIQSNIFLRSAYNWWGFTSTGHFLTFLGAASFALLVVAAMVRTIGQYTLARFAQMRRHTIGARLFETYLRQPYEFYLDRHTGELSKGILSEVDQVVSQVFESSAILISQFLTLITIILLLLVIDPLVAGIAGLVLTVAYGTLYRIVRPKLRQIGSAQVEANRRRFEVTGEALSGIKDFKLLGRENAYLKKFMKPSFDVANHITMNLTLSEVPKYIMEAVAFGSIILLSLFLMARYGGHESGALGEVLPLLGVYAFAGYRLLPAVQAIYQAMSKIRFGAPALDNLWSDLAAAGQLPALPVSPPTRILVREMIKLIDISYGYPNSNGVGVQNICINIPVGSKFGIVGSTGAGKTTLVDIILGLLPPTSGKLVVDSVEILGDNVRGWQANIGYVPQDIFLVDGSVAENIALGIPVDQIDHYQIRESARLAQIQHFVEEELQQSYSTKVGERGIRLSGGQRQRIGIARALYHNPQVLVFDEATSALDNLTEKELVAAIGKLSNTKTIIMIAHRLSTVKGCDQILVLEKGRTVGLGNYSELVRDNPAFKRIATSSANA